MNDTRDIPQPAAPSTDRPRRRFSRRAALASVVAALATGVGLTAFAHGGGGWHRGGLMGARLDPAGMEARLDRMLKHLYVEVDATETQKQQLGPIVKAAARDLLPVRERMRGARRQAVALLSQPSIDRGALETLRADQLRLAEQASRRFTEALADLADVLTPEQRKRLAERAERWHGPRG